ncbi:hypothetical protein HOH87_08060 [bacterium]|jgi:hypothetical protein|nr:hypothetical protein [bacterium]
MAQLTELSHFIETDDIKGFLKTYMILLKEGFTLSIPLETDVKKVVEAWTQIVSRISRRFEDSFVINLSKLWLISINKIGATVDDTFPLRMIQQLDPDYIDEDQPDTLPSPQTKPSSNGSLKIRLPEINGTEKPNEISSNISPDYYAYEAAQKTVVPKTDAIENDIQEAIGSDNPNGFLVHYLSQVRLGKSPKLPMSSVLNIIQTQWEEILLSDLEVHPSDEFIDQVSAIWFHAVNQKGLPHTGESQEDMLIFLMSRYEEPARKPNKVPLLNRLFRS